MIEKKIVLVGVGQLDRRRLQALAKSNKNYKTYIIDPSKELLDLAIIDSDVRVRLGIIKKLINNIKNIKFNFGKSTI